MAFPVCFYILFFFTQKINLIKLVNLIFISTISYIIAIFNFELLTNFSFDFGIVRFSYIIANSHLLGNYPILGFGILLGVWFFQKNKTNQFSINYLQSICCLIVMVIAIFISGARQSIIISFLIPV